MECQKGFQMLFSKELAAGECDHGNPHSFYITAMLGKKTCLDEGASLG